MYDLRAFVPSEECLKCDRCCRFLEKETIWAPVFSSSEVEEVINRGYPPSLFNAGRVGFKDVRIRPKKGIRYEYVCPFFDEEKNCCDIYPIRPFDCRLYPFLLVGAEGDVFLGVDEDCPYVERLLRDKKGETIIHKRGQYLLQFLTSPKGRELMATHPQMIARYRGRIRMLFPIE